MFGFKCFLADSGVPEFPPLDTEGLGGAMREVAGFDGLLLVHAEDPAVLLRGATTPTRSFRDFMGTRPDEAEVAAITTVIEGVREHGTRTHLLHLSSALALDLIADARAEGLAADGRDLPALPRVRRRLTAGLRLGVQVLPADP